MSAPPGRRGLALLVIVVAALAAGTASPAADRTVVKRLTVSGLGHRTAAIRTRVLTHATRRLAQFPATAWGGTYTTKSGAHVTIYSSRSYAVDQAANQAAAEFIDGLVHGTEISKVRIYFAPIQEVGAVCQSAEVVGCYIPSTGEIVTIGEDTEWGTVEEVVTHEYGHHVAANRDNAPWPAIAYGTKRWATYEGVCQKEAGGTAFPGDEGEHYFQNPGEAFAESFLHLNEVKLGLPETPWGYDPMFTPDAGALAAIEKDVLQPWTSETMRIWRGRFVRAGQRRRLTIKTPLDGVFGAQLRGPTGSVLTLRGPAETKRLSPTLSAGLICGQRSVKTTLFAGRAGRYAAAALIP